MACIDLPLHSMVNATGTAVPEGQVDRCTNCSLIILTLPELRYGPNFHAIYLHGKGKWLRIRDIPASCDEYFVYRIHES